MVVVAELQGQDGLDAGSGWLGASGYPIAGLGVDIVEIARMETVLARTPRFAQRVFTDGERDYCERHHRPAAHYATHFAAKEAVLKALGTGFAQGIGPADVEITHDDRGRPLVLLHERAQQIAVERGVVEVQVSLSRTHGTAVANAICITRESRPRRAEKHDPRSELTAAFKELRGMLDDMGAADAADEASAAGEEPENA